MSIKLFIIMFSLTLCFEAFAIPVSTKGIFNKIRENYYKSFPKDFTASVVGPEINKSLSKIPKNAYCENKSPKVSYLYLKHKEENIIVENVENPYVTRFQLYLNMYKGTKIFLNSSISFLQLKKVFYWSYRPSLSKKYYVIKMRRHRIRKSDYMLLYVDKKDFSIKKAVKYSNERAIGTLLITYKKVKSYNIPSSLKFNILRKGKMEKFNLLIKSYKLNTGLTKEKIIQLQNDCPSLN